MDEFSRERSKVRVTALIRFVYSLIYSFNRIYRCIVCHFHYQRRLIFVRMSRFRLISVGKNLFQTYKIPIVIGGCAFSCCLGRRMMSTSNKKGQDVEFNTATSKVTTRGNVESKEKSLRGKNCLSLLLFHTLFIHSLKETTLRA